jgi:hypothetical protein
MLGRLMRQVNRTQAAPANAKGRESVPTWGRRGELLLTQRNDTGAIIQKEPNSCTATQNQRQTQLKQETGGWPAGAAFSRLFESPQVPLFQRGSYHLVKGRGRWRRRIRFEAEAPPSRRDGNHLRRLSPDVCTVTGKVTAKGGRRAALVRYFGRVSGLPHL